MSESAPPNPAPSYRGLLALVIILGVLIVVGTIGLIVGAILRARGSTQEPAAYAARVMAPGERIESATMEGGRILLRLSGGANGDELVVIDSGTGRVAGRIAVETK